MILISSKWIGTIPRTFYAYSNYSLFVLRSIVGTAVCPFHALSCLAFMQSAFLTPIQCLHPPIIDLRPRSVRMTWMRQWLDARCSASAMVDNREGFWHHTMKIGQGRCEASLRYPWKYCCVSNGCTMIVRIFLSLSIRHLRNSVSF